MNNFCSPLFANPNEDSCCSDLVQNTISDTQCNMSSYYGILSNTITDLINKASIAEYYGKTQESKDLYNCINDYHYLFLYLEFINKQRKLDADMDLICHKDKGNFFYIDAYKISCIKKYFMCRNIDISNLLNIFGLDTLNDLPDGINEMHLEVDNQNNDNCPDNDQLFIVEKP